MRTYLAADGRAHLEAEGLRDHAGVEGLAELGPVQVPADEDEAALARLVGAPRLALRRAEEHVHALCGDVGMGGQHRRGHTVNNGRGHQTNGGDGVSCLRFAYLEDVLGVEALDGDHALFMNRSGGVMCGCVSAWTLP